jgi:CHAT domain-containing protein
MKKLILIIVYVAFQLEFTNAFSQSWQRCDSLTRVFYNKQSYDTALFYSYCSINELKASAVGSDSILVESIKTMVGIFKKTNNVKKAIDKLEEIKTDIKEIIGDENDTYAEVCNEQALLHYSLRNYSVAEKLFHIAKKLKEKEYGKNNSGYEAICTNLAALNKNIGKFSESQAFFIESKNIQEQIYGKEHQRYASTCNNLAYLYFDIGNFIDAEKLFIESKAIREKIFGKNHLDYAQSCNNLAQLYLKIGRYSEAESLYLESLGIRERIVGNQNPAYATVCSNIGWFYKETGNYSLSEKYYLEAKAIRENTLGKESASYALICNNLAELYQSIGNFQAAEALHLESSTITEKIFGANHSNYAISCNNIGALYKDIGKFSESESMYLKAKNIFELSYGKESNYYATLCNNLGLLYQSMRNYSESELLFLEAKNIFEKLFGNQHPAYASATHNLGLLYSLIHKDSLAKEAFIVAANIRENALGKSHPEYSQACINLARTYEDLNDLIAAETLYVESINLKNNNITKNFSFLSEREKEMYFKTEEHSFASLYSFAIRYKEQKPEIANFIFDNILRNKGLLLKSSTAIRTAILNGNDTSLIKQYNCWVQQKREIASIYSQEISKRKKDPVALEQEANAMEKVLVSKVQTFSDFEKMQGINWETVRSNLKPYEAAIEFINFAVAGRKDSVLYAALIVKPNSKFPEMIPLFYEKDLEAILGKIADNNLRYVNSIYGTNTNPNENLYSLIWKPIEAYIVGAKTIYLSPSGLLHKVSFAAMAKGKNVYLCDSYNLNTQSSTAKVALPSTFLLNRDITASVFGGINYNADNSEEEVWNYLEGTKHEAEIVKNLLSKKKVKTNMFVGNESTEEAMKLSNTNVIHIATHGFFYPDPKEQQLAEAKKVEAGEVFFRGGRGTRGFGVWSFVRNPNPLMRSGLTFAGANRVWTDKYVSSESDGVLTAEEVVNIDMRNTELVVLSACETGLGDIKGSEGVYGLQRAFKMAGAKYIIMSLWQVPDKETVEFMETFYTKLLKKKDLRKAFVETQQTMRAKYDPYYWAAFVLVE